MLFFKLFFLIFLINGFSKKSYKLFVYLLKIEIFFQRHVSNNSKNSFLVNFIEDKSRTNYREKNKSEIKFSFTKFFKIKKMIVAVVFITF